ncbi:hypothetical protein D3C87_1838380 [compost metagenome]
MLRRKPKRKAEGSQLHQPLILLPHIAPVIGMGGIGAIGDSSGQKRPMGEGIAAERKRRDAPEWSRKSFQIGRCPVEMRGGAAKRHSCAAL